MASNIKYGETLHLQFISVSCHTAFCQSDVNRLFHAVNNFKLLSLNVSYVEHTQTEIRFESILL